MNLLPPQGPGELVIYQTADGGTRLEVRLAGESVWLSLNQLADLFQRDKSVISKHIKNIFADEELDPFRTVARFATVQTEGSRSVTREIECYRLEVILAVGYRVLHAAPCSADGPPRAWKSTSSRASPWMTSG